MFQSWDRLSSGTLHKARSFCHCMACFAQLGVSMQCRVSASLPSRYRYSVVKSILGKSDCKVAARGKGPTPLEMRLLSSCTRSRLNGFWVSAEDPLGGGHLAPRITQCSELAQIDEHLPTTAKFPGCPAPIINSSGSIVASASKER